MYYSIKFVIKKNTTGKRFLLFNYDCVVSIADMFASFIGISCNSDKINGAWKWSYLAYIGKFIVSI